MTDIQDLLKNLGSNGSAGILSTQRDLISQKTPQEMQGQRLMDFGSSINNGSTLGAIVGGVASGVGQAKVSKAEQERAVKMQKLQEWLDQEQARQAQTLQFVEQARTIALAEQAKQMKQGAVDTAAFSALNSGDASGLEDVVRSDENMQKLFSMDMPEGATFQGLKVMDGNLVPVGIDPQGNMVLGQPKPVTKFMSPAGLEAWTKQRQAEAELQNTQAGTLKSLTDAGVSVPVPAGMVPEAQPQGVVGK